MKEITIFQKNNPPLVFTDEDTSEIEGYTKELTSLLEASNVIVLETTSGNIIIRPHTINSIKVINIEDVEEDVEEQELKEDVKEVVTEDIIEDIITDGD